MKLFILIAVTIFFIPSWRQKKEEDPVLKKDVADKRNSADTLKRPGAGDTLPDSVRQKLLDSAIMYGNTDAYARATEGRLLLAPGFINPALIMANKYKDPRAAFDVYSMLCTEGYDSLSIELGTLDKKTKNTGLYYLLRSYEQGYEEARYEVEEMYTDKHLKIPVSGDLHSFK